MIPPLEALERLRQGNRRFANGVRRTEALSQEKREQFVAGQAPFATVLACSDSRVPVEQIFDQGYGDLFVIRVAGNIAAPSQIGSAEYAALHLGATLLVALGHTGCGAVGATLESLRKPGEPLSDNLAAIVQRIRPAVEPLLGTASPDEEDTLLNEAMRANVRITVQTLRRDSEILRNLMDEGRLLVVGAAYSLKSGKVEFFDEAPDVLSRKTEKE